MCPTPLCGSTNAVFMGRKLHCVYVMLRMRPQGWRQLLTFDYGTHYLKKAENCRKMSNCRGAPSCVSCVLGRGKCSTWLTKKCITYKSLFTHTSFNANDNCNNETIYIMYRHYSNLLM